MNIYRKQDLSVYYFIKELFKEENFVTIVDGYPEEELVLPSIAITNEDIDTYEFQLGSTSRIKIRDWYIEVFAKNKSQRDDFAYKILEALEKSIPVYNFDEGFPPETLLEDLTKIGCLQPEEISMRIVKIMSELVEKLYFRATIIFTAIHNKI